MSNAARSSHSVVSIGASDPSFPKDLTLSLQQTRTHALSFHVTCVLMSSHSCAAVVLWVRAVYSDCLPLLPTAQIRAGTLVARSTGLRQTSSTATPHQDAGFSIIRQNEVNLGPSTPSLSSPFSAPVIIMLRLSALLLDITGCLRCQQFTVHITFLVGCETVSMEPPLQDESKRSSSEFAECTCIRTTSGFRKCDVARSATTLIFLARTDGVDEPHTPPL